MSVGAAGWMRSAAAFSGLEVAARATGIAAYLLLARVMDSSDFGLTVTALAAATFVAGVVEMGAGTLALREASKRLAKGAGIALAAGNQVAEAALRRVLPAVGTLLLVAYVLDGQLSLLPSGDRGPILLLGLYPVLLTLSLLYESGLRVTRNFRVLGFATAIDKGLLLVAVGALGAAGIVGLTSVAGVFVASAAGRLVFTRTVSRRLASPAQETIRATSFARASMRVGAARLAITTVPQLDTALVATASLSLAGAYAVGERVVGAAVLFAVPMTMAGFASAKDVSLRLVRRLAALTMVPAAVAAFFTPSVLPLVVGGDYSSSSEMIGLMFLAVPPVMASSALLPRLYRADQERPVAGRAWSVALVAVIVLPISAHMFGLGGAVAVFVVRQYWLALSFFRLASRLPGEGGA